MNNYKIYNNEDSIFLEIFTSHRHRASLVFVTGIATTMLLIPILIVFFVIKELSIGVIISWILAWSISGFFVKLYLWNKYGKEVFVMNNNYLKVYNDYKYFKENYRCYQFTKLNITFFVGTEAFFAKEEVKNIDIHQLSEIGFQLDKDVVISHKELPILKIIEIAKQISNV
ncbi:MAG: hypothetical protein E6772_03255 [Dysgonomonas sp.]|nr:hypothetical protein [Dysgonomonas sp.]